MLVFDVEADGLLDEATKIHVLSYTRDGKDIQSIYDYDEMRGLLLSEKLLIGHNIVMYDIPLLEKLLQIKIEARLWDTLPMSWYINHDRMIHGLDSYGKQYGVPKPKIDDWQSLSREEYAYRCQEDVKINWHLWRDLRSSFLDIYEDRVEVERFLDYLTFKMDCAKSASFSKWKVDLPRVRKNIVKLELQQKQKLEALIEAMPPREIWTDKSRPAKPFKKDGTYSVTGAKWFSLCRSKGYSENYKGTIPVLVRTEPANPNSSDQVKDWLTSLGWKPTSFNYVKNDEGIERSIPQVRVDGDDGKELCKSVLVLAEEHPEIRLLEGLTVIQHRLGIFKNFEKFQEDGYLKAEIHGLTNTLRFKHKNPLVNLPGVDKPWGEEIRGSLIAPEGMILCGSDMVSLEDTTKRHYMTKYDPKYVEEMSKEGFDPHLDLALYAKAVTKQELDDYVNGVEGCKNLKPIRKDYKVANYACIYGVGPPKLARTTGLPQSKAKKLIEAYWGRNWSVQKVIDDTITKIVNGKLWLYNPVSKFWYSLRYEKDKFSTLNQGTGVYCFDTWIKYWREVREQLTGQFHDEIISCIPKGREKEYENILRTAIDKTNKELKLNVLLDIDVQFGKDYSQIH